MASISESDAADSNKKIKGRGTSFDLKKAPICLQEFLNKLSWDEDKLNRLWLSKDKLFLNPAIIPDTKGLRTMRTGVYLGELKKNRFEPSQSFAMILKDSEFDNTINLSAKSQAVYRYLRGETLDIDEMTADDIIGSSDIKNGWTLVEVEGYPLGFAKNVNGTLKNKYLPGWRMQ